jgi:hypothetical protein
VFIWQAAHAEPAYRHAVMRDFYTNWELRDYKEARSINGFVNRTSQKGGIVLFFICGIALMPALIMLPRVFTDRRLRYVVLAGGIFAFGLIFNVWLFPHYLAPFIAGFYAMLLQCLRHLRASRPSGLALVRMIPLLCIVLAAFRLAATPLEIQVPRWPSMWYGTESFGLRRSEIASRLAGYPGKQLAVVRYAPSHVPFDDWVYNPADINRAKVIWAREMDPGDDTKLAAYFHDRRVWLVEPDAVPPRVTPWIEPPAANNSRP